MFRLVEQRNGVKQAYQIGLDDKLKKIDETSSMLTHGEQRIKFSHTSDVMAGDYIIKQSESDIYHCPQDVFNEKYRQMGTKGLSFGQAIESAKAGEKIAREGWNGKNMWVASMSGMSLPAHSCQEPGAKVNDRTATLIGEDTPLETLPYFAMWTADQKWLPGWLASQTDMLAEDWCVVQ